MKYRHSQAIWIRHKRNSNSIQQLSSRAQPYAIDQAEFEFSNTQLERFVSRIELVIFFVLLNYVIALYILLTLSLIVESSSNMKIGKWALSSPNKSQVDLELDSIWAQFNSIISLIIIYKII